MSAPSKGPSKGQVLLVEFEYGDPAAPTLTRIATASESIPASGGDYASEPRVDVKLPRMTGTLKQKEAQVEVPLAAGGFSDAASNGEPHSPILCRVWERIEWGGEVATRSLFSGRVRLVTRNAGGRRGRVRLDVASPKDMLDVRLGISISHSCRWTFGDQHTCKVDADALEKQGTVVSIDGPVLQVSGVTGDYGGAKARWWHRGSMRRDGLVLSIRDWTEAQEDRYVLVREPPAGWLGQMVTVRPGCDKLYPTCSQRWGNAGNFQAIGYGMPSYNPVIEDPGP